MDFIKLTLQKDSFKPVSEKIWYKYDGFGGYQNPKNGWKKNSLCFSPIASNETKSLCRIPEPRAHTLSEWKDMVRTVKKISSGVRQCLRENPPDFIENTMMFNSGNGYCDYLAFAAWRMYYQDQRTWYKLRVIMKQGYGLHDSWIILCRLLPGLSYRINVGIGNIYKGSAKRLKNISRAKNKGNYEMAGIVAKLWKSEKFIFNEGYPLKTTKDMLTDTELFDRIVEFANCRKE